MHFTVFYRPSLRIGEAAGCKGYSRGGEVESRNKKKYKHLRCKKKGFQATAKGERLIAIEPIDKSEPPTGGENIAKQTRT